MAFRYGVEEFDLFVEQGTERVPDDERFHIMLKGAEIEAHSSMKRALTRLQQLRHSLAAGAAVDGPENPRLQMLQAEMAHRFLQESTAQKRANRTRKGGKGRA